MYLSVAWYSIVTAETDSWSPWGADTALESVSIVHGLLFVCMHHCCIVSFARQSLPYVCDMLHWDIKGHCCVVKREGKFQIHFCAAKLRPDRQLATRERREKRYNMYLSAFYMYINIC